MNALSVGRLGPQTVFEPLWNQWYAWSYLIPPASASRYLEESHIPTMQSFVDDPEIHVETLRNPAMRGGPFLECEAERANEILSLIHI